jgi:hypothetical protein
MQRALEMFTFERGSSSSPLVETTWSTHSEVVVEPFLSVAVSHWEIVVTRQDAAAWLTVRGPETRPTTAPVPCDAAFLGIRFTHGTFMPALGPQHLVDGSVTLPAAAPGSCWLDGTAWELPGPDDVDVFVERLVAAGLLVHDPVVAAAVHDDVATVSTRTLERRVVRATGLTRGMIRQIRRAEQAVELLGRGVPALDVVRLAGFADQPHLTRSLKRFIGRTPSQIGVG